MLVVCNLMEKDLVNLPNLKRTISNAGIDFKFAVRLQGDFKFDSDLKIDYLTKGENIGNPQGLNKQIKENLKDCKDGIAILAPDLVMPNNWLLKSVEACKAISDTGLVGYKWQPVTGRVYSLNGIDIEQHQKLFGCIFISPKAFQKCGYFLEISKYGLWDNEYFERTIRAGFRNYYLKGFESTHNPSGRDSEVRAFKDEQMKIAYRELQNNAEYYQNLIYYETNQ